ncbi:hypothetical protein EVAR_34474_1 [Eumeta japonica]|uniref:Uncharacterized protein n=1 Tax=Eumeta variegata TaxID=151549 RepID=A0A4C1WXX3_EUMVA|nr:hypothetical protein EVAR_34474_1 [Eumeta japonica]
MTTRGAGAGRYAVRAGDGPQQKQRRGAGGTLERARGSRPTARCLLTRFTDNATTKVIALSEGQTSLQATRVCSHRRPWTIVTQSQYTAGLLEIGYLMERGLTEGMGDVRLLLESRNSQVRYCGTCGLGAIIRDDVAVEIFINIRKGSECN